MGWPKSMPIVEVEWIDSSSGCSTWRFPEDQDVDALPCKTAGYLLKKDRKSVVIFQSQASSGHVADSMTIPRSCVKEIRVLAKAGRKSR